MTTSTRNRIGVNHTRSRSASRTAQTAPTPTTLVLLVATASAGLTVLTLWDVQLSALVVGGVVALFLCLIAVWSPRLTWLLFAIAMFADRLAIGLGPVSLRFEHLALILLIASAARRPIGLKNSARTNVLVGTILFAAWCGLALITSSIVPPEPVRSYYIIALYASGFIAFAVTARTGDGAWRAVTSTNVLSAISIASLLSWLAAESGQFVTPLVILNSYETTHRVQGLMVEPNFLGSACAMWLCVLYAYRRNFSAFGLFWHATIFAFTILLSFTRAAWLSAALVGGMIIIFAAKRRIQKIIAASATGIAIVSLFSLTAPAGMAADLVTYRLNSLFNFETGTGAFRARDWDMAVAQLSDLGGWIWGLGVNSYSQRNLSTETSSGEAYLGNFWLALVHDTGLVGAALMVSALVAVMVACRPPLAGILLASVVALTSTATNQMWFAFPWVAIGLLVTMNSQPTSSKEIVPLSRRAVRDDQSVLANR